MESSSGSLAVALFADHLMNRRSMFGFIEIETTLTDMISLSGFKVELSGRSDRE